METVLIVSFLLSLVLSLLLIPLLIKHSARLNLVDDPVGSARKLHEAPMPRSGGLGIIMAAAVALLIMLPLDESLFSFLLACLVIIGFGLLDDIVELKPVQKLAGQALGIVIAMAGGMVIGEVPLLPDSPDWFCYALTFVFVLGVINGVNFSDGMDGLAAGTTLMALLLIFVLATEANNNQVATIALAVSAALIGFLRFNTHPASIFMGDAGSQFLGFVVAWLAIAVSQAESAPITTLMPLLILGIPVMDILQVVPVRIKKKLPLPGPDREHFHHQIAKLGFYQYEVVAIIYVLQAVLLGSAYVLRYGYDPVIFLLYLAFVATILGLIYYGHSSGWRIRDPLVHASKDRRNRIFRKLGELHTISGKFYGAAIAVALALAALASNELPSSLVYLALLLATLLLIAKIFTRERFPMAMGRLATYSATIFLVYGMTVSIRSPAYDLLVNGALVLLALLLVVSIRTTRKDYFWLTTQDLLVLFFIVLLAPRVPMELGQDLSTGALIFRTCVLLYACEYVLARGEQARKRLTVASIVALFLMCWHL
ncbi:MAG: MraY family glycosyltransferase [Pseudomonadota bacterium]